MKDSIFSGRNVVAVLAIAYCALLSTTTVECWSITAFHVEATPPLRSIIQHSIVIHKLTQSRSNDKILLRAVPPRINDDNDSDNLIEEQLRNGLGRSKRRRTRTLQRDDDDANVDTEDDFNSVSIDRKSVV